MKVLLIGSGAREHALGWKILSSPRVKELILCPGNDAMEKQLGLDGRRIERWELTQDYRSLAKRAVAARIELAVIGPDDPLAAGIVDAFEAEGLTCFGPSRAAAQLEASKAFAKEIMWAAHVPTARFETFTDLVKACTFVREVEWGGGWVVKADGLALGKGVEVCTTREQAQAACERLFPVSRKLLIEEKLQGEELSVLALCDGADCALFAPARDYKRVGDGDVGPNTGGMGAYTPVEQWESDEFLSRLEREVFRPVLLEMAQRGTPFKGVLYAGLMADAHRDRYWVLEFNARFGDPETEVLLPRMQGELLPWLIACAKGDLKRLVSGKGSRIPMRPESFVYVVGASQGYPDSPRKGDSIEGLRWEPGREFPHYFYAGVAARDEDWITSGGRVLGALGVGTNLASARGQAYQYLERIKWKGMHYRGDIAT